VANERFLNAESEAASPAPAMPPYPRAGNLVPFSVETTDNRYFVDRSSLAVSGNIVTYVLVVRSPAGVDNVFFEALNCREREQRTYARGTSDRKWIVRPSEWRRIETRASLGQYVLHREFFCPDRTAIVSVAEGILALQKGGHPNAKGIGGPSR
jgi:hypothetical protein